LNIFEHWYDKVKFWKTETNWIPSRRIATEDGNAVIFDECRPQVFHGYVANWAELTDQQRVLLYESGLCKTMKQDNHAH
jgi:hypothetical protein